MAIKTDKRETTLISYIGVPQCDIVYYFARILNAADKRVLIVDNTLDHDMFHSLRKPDEKNMVEIGDISVVCNKKYSEYFFNYYDYVLIYHGMNINEELNENSDFRYVISTFNPFIVKKVAAQLKKANDNLGYYVVLRDKVYDKISEKTILSELALKATQVKETYQLPYSETDYICYMNLLWNGSQQPKHASGDMRDCLRSILSSVMPSQMTKKELDKIFKKAMTGKIK